MSHVKRRSVTANNHCNNWLQDMHPRSDEQHRASNTQVGFKGPLNIDKKWFTTTTTLYGGLHIHLECLHSLTLCSSKWY